MRQSYFIDPERGIYYTQSAYGDEVERIYMVDFADPDINDQFQSFQRWVRKDGADEKMSKLREQFKALRELF